MEIKLESEDWEKLEKDTNLRIEGLSKELALSLEILKLCQTRITRKVSEKKEDLSKMPLGTD